ncbi:solute carrier family 12 member 6-like [Haliotis asinina]|uniref:solute carrier family 12 member 6-like n=1 Tax=Haliotis asinina TaxID=109174 RepID=UPI0035327868
MPGTRFKVTKSDYGVTREDAAKDNRPEHTDIDTIEINLDDVDGCINTASDGTNKTPENGVQENGEPGQMALYEDNIKKKGRLSHLLSGIAHYQAGIAPVPDEEIGSKQTKKANLGTILGVYLPCIQNIFGVIYFVRLSWIVGTAGALEAFSIVFICSSVSLLTSFSMSAIATNGVVTGGGSYFMISRSLGPEFGGAVGILFYLGLSVSVAMYFIGSIEILLTYLAPEIAIFTGGTEADMYNNFRVYGTILLLIIALVVLVGVRFVTKVSSLTLAFVIVSVICIYIGIFVSNADNSIRVCMLGDHILPYSKVVMNGTMMCIKNETGPLFNMFCTEVNSSYTSCDPYFLNNDVRVVPGIPGITSGVFMDNLYSHYTQAGVHPDSSTVANKQRGDITTDIATSFMILLAIYFPSITGFEQGANYSGDLKDPQKSIPKGTLWAVGSTSLIYLSSVLFFAACIEGPLLRDKFGESINGDLVIAQLAWPTRWVIIIGSFQSTVGAGLQALTGAPRLLQAIAKDNVIPFLHFFSHTTKGGEPIRGLILSTLIAELGILIAKLDYVAPIVTMFFLMCYGFINLACALQTLLRLPHWRPRFWCYHWSLSLMGLGLCLSLMFISSWYYALIAMVLACAVYKYVEYKGAEKEWGDGMRGLAMSAAQHALFRMKGSSSHTKNWRPQLLLLVKLDEDFTPKSPKLMTFACQLKAGRGLTMVNSVLEGEYAEHVDDIKTARKSLDEWIEKSKIRGFSDVIMSHTLEEGICHVIQNAGLGVLRHNTVMLAWPDEWSEQRQEKGYRVFLETLKNINASELSLMVLKGIDHFPENSDRLKGTLDIWWIVHDGGLLMLLPFLLKQHRTWSKCSIRIFTVAQLEDNSIQLKEDLKKYLYHLRINAEVEVVEMYDNDISAYIYERTLQMEQRTKILQQMNLKKKHSLQEAQSIMDRIHRESSIKLPTERVQFNLESRSTLSVEPEERVHYTFSGGSTSGLRNPRDVESDEDATPDSCNVKRMHTAVSLNKHIKDKSRDAQLVILNLPSPPTSETRQSHYMSFLEALTEGLDRVLMVHGSGSEVITIYS